MVTDTEEKTKYWCRKCYRQNEIGTNECVYCGNRLTPMYEKEAYYLNSDGLGKLMQETVYKPPICPRCHSENCSWYVQQNVIPGKTKTSVKLNLNPFKPFTLFNVKEKVVREPITFEERRVLCNDCGNTFTPH